MAVKYLDNAGTQYLVNKIKAIDGKIPTESQITTMITTALNTYKEGIVTIVESLPQTGEEGKLYLMVDPSDSDVYIIYTWEENAFKRMGSKTFTLTVDSALSDSSTNPVQNKVIKSALDGKANAPHTHGSITNDGKLGTSSRVVITGNDKKIGISTVTTTELGYLSGVTSDIQTQLNSKSATGHTHTAGDVAGLATVATSGSYNDLSNKPTINDSTITIQKNGSTVDSFTTNGSNKTINIAVPTKTSDLTNDSGFLTSTDISSKANDSEVLHKAQTETVTGEKTFKKDIKIIDLNANERPGVKFEVNGSFRTFEDAKDALPDTDFGDFGVGTVWSAFWLDDNTKIQNSMSDYVINDITFGTTNYGSVIELNNYYKVKYEEADNIQTDLRGMLRFELAPYAGVQKDSMIWTEPKLYFYAKLENDEFGDTILGHEDAHWSKAYINEINCYEIKFGGNSIHDILEHIVSLSYVTHYSSTALTSNSTNSLSIIDNQDSVKVNDKVIDSSGKMFYITSVDLRNNEFEVGSVVDTFAKDSAVVHSSGNETVSGVKTFSDDTFVKSLNFTNEVANSSSSSVSTLPIVTTVTYTDQSASQSARVNLRITADGSKSFFPNENGSYSLGLVSRNWDNVFSYMFEAFGKNLGDEFSTNARTNLYLKANRDTGGKSGAYISRFRQNKAQGSLASGDFQILAIDFLENEVRTNGVLQIQGTGWVDDAPTKGFIISTVPNYTFGSSSKPCKINDLEPSSLGMPDLDNGIDISSYITVVANANKESFYTPPANGWICVRLSRTSGASGVLLIQGDLAISGKNIEVESGVTTADATIPVIGGVQVSINSALADRVVSAYFYPCQGNV